MTEQKIAKNRQQVVFTLANGDKVEGDVFLSLYEAHRQGPQRVGELLNGKESFIPLKTEAGTLHLNTGNIVQARIPTEQEQHDLMTLGRKYAVRLTTVQGDEIEGDMFVDLPSDRSRVSDYLNQSERFLRLFVPGHILYIGRRSILTVQD